MRFFPKSFRKIPRSAIILPLVTFALIAAIIFAGDSIPVKEWLKLPTEYFGHKKTELATLKERISRISGVVQEGQTLNALMESFQLSPENIRLIVTAAKPYADLNRLHEGNQYYVITGEHGELRGFEYYTDPEHLLKIIEKEGGYTATLEVLPVTVKTTVRTGTVESSLHESLKIAGIEPDMARDFVGIFAGEVDFSSDLRPGASWRMLYEEKWRDGKVQGVGRLLMAELVNAGKEFTGVWYETEPGKGAYYTPEGRSIRRMFLKMPIEHRQTAASRSFRISRRGNAVEYDLLPGTSVLTVADGRIISLGSMKGRGKTLTLRHEGGVITQFTHLGGYARGVSKGAWVRQGAVLGYAGDAKKNRSFITFLAQKKGKAIDPLKLPDLPATRIAPKDMSRFRSFLHEKTALLHQSQP